MVIALFAGLRAYHDLGRDEDPPFTIKVMIVRAFWPGADANQTAKQLTDRLEKPLESLAVHRLRHQLHQARRSHDHGHPARQHAAVGGARPVVPGAQEDRRHPRPAAAGRHRPVLQRRLRRRVRRHLRADQRWLHLSRAARPGRVHPRRAAAREQRGQGGSHRRAGRSHLHRLQPAADGGPRHRSGPGCADAGQPERGDRLRHHRDARRTHRGARQRRARFGGSVSRTSRFASATGTCGSRISRT